MSRRSSALRRRRKPSLATRFKVAWVFIVTLVAGAAYAGYVLITLPQLRVQSIAVRIDGLAVRERDVLAAANVDRRRNMWLLDTGAMAMRIEAIPYVERADIQRLPLARLAIHVSEREPAACVRRGTRVVTLDRDRRILQDGCARAGAMRIELRSGVLGQPGTFATPPGLATLLTDGRVLNAAGVGVRSVTQDRFGQLVATEGSGIELLFGSDNDLTEKASLVGPVLAATRPGHAIRTIDLRSPATPTVEFR